jgi:hypothetical protein
MDIYEQKNVPFMQLVHTGVLRSDLQSVTIDLQLTVRIMMKLNLFGPITKHITGSQCKIVVFIGLPVVRISCDVPEAGAICVIVQYCWTFVVHSGER